MLPKSPQSIDYIEAYRRTAEDDPHPRPLTVFDHPRKDFLALITVVLTMHLGLIALAWYLAV